MHAYETMILKVLSEKKTINLENLLSQVDISKDAVLWAVENLAKEDALKVKREELITAKVTKEGLEYLRNGFPEEKLLENIYSLPVSLKELGAQQRIGMQWLKAKGFATIKEGKLFITEIGKELKGRIVEEHLALNMIVEKDEAYSQIKEEHEEAVNNLLKRKLISVSKKSMVSEISITEKGLSTDTDKNAEDYIDKLDKKSIKDKSWETKKFKPYDVTLEVKRTNPAKPHPLRSIINELKDAYVGMGFKEVSGPIIEPAFWPFDSLFSPQDHPARDMQDTFYISNPEKIPLSETEPIEAVAKAHAKGWHYKWSKEVAEQTVLRPHTTSVSARYIYGLGKLTSYQLPIKLFSVGRVFRNEAIDYRHLADFYQVDGIVIGEKLTLANLFDTLIRIYDSVGIKIRFRPSFFPFVEPAAEVEAYYEKRDEWLELAGSGIIRKEIVDPSSKKLTVLAWGHGVERIGLLKQGIENVTEFYGSSLGWLRNR